MTKEAVFEILDTVLIARNQWLIRGRAHGEVYKGDVLYASEITESIKENYFTVIFISTYGKEVDELVPPLTGNLVLQVETGDGAILYSSQYLQKEI